jgi:lipopolysaccharide transport system ATP-binding protein
VLDHYLSTVQLRAGETLDHRDDREGDGHLRVQRVDVSGPNHGSLRTGEACSIGLQYVASVPPGPIMINLAIEGPFGEPLFVCSTAVTGDDLATASQQGEFVCVIPSLPLLAGRYSMTLYVQAGGVLADKVSNAVYFDVFESDAFGTGRLPPSAFGRMIVDHSWHLAAPVDHTEPRLVG